MRALRMDSRRPLLMLPLIATFLSGCQDLVLPTGPMPFSVVRDIAPGTCVVSNTNDTGAGSLRNAVNDPACSVITFDPSLNGQTITLTSVGLVIPRHLAIKGPGAGQLSIVREPAATGFFGAIFLIMSGKTVSISGVTISGGQASFDGAGIANFGSLTLTDVTLSNNFAQRFGGAIYSVGPLVLINSIVSGNGASQLGGGVYVLGTTATITNSTISGNTALGGGGLWVDSGTLVLTNSTVSGNTAASHATSSGGGMFLVGGSTVVLTNVTVTNNSATQQGSGISVDFFAGTVVIMRNTIVAANVNNAFGRPDISGAVEATYSLIGSQIGTTLNAEAETTSVARPTSVHCRTTAAVRPPTHFSPEAQRSTPPTTATAPPSISAATFVPAREPMSATSAHSKPVPHRRPRRRPI